jgi:phage protein D
MNIAIPKFTVLYNNKNITADISKHMLSLTYNDKTEGESDEIEIEVEDVDLKWQNSWYPEKGAKLTVTIESLKCGVFEIDEIQLSGPPDVVTIRGMATGIVNSLRTKKSDAHESKTLKQIAEKVASKNNLTIQGEIPEITFGRITQNKETDLAFLKRISQEYGVLFAVRENIITFTSIYDVEKRNTSFTLDKSEISKFTFKDKADGMIKSASVKSKSAKKNEPVTANLDFEKYKKEQGYSSDTPVNRDEGVTHTKAENKQQAEAKAKAIMHLSASNQIEGSIDIQGTVLAVAGNNVQVTGFGKLSGKFHIKSSSHKIDKSSGYTVSLEMKRLNLPLKTERITKPKKKQQSNNVEVRNFKFPSNKYPYGNPTKIQE